MVESDSGNVVIRPGPITVNLSPRAFHLWATDFLQAFAGYPHRPGFSPVPHFLLARAIELEIKSRHLLSKTQDDVTRYKHDLYKAYEALPPDAATLELGEVADLRALSTIYRSKDLEYWSPELALQGYAQGHAVRKRKWPQQARLPELIRVERIARKLLLTGVHTPELCRHQLAP